MTKISRPSSWFPRVASPSSARCSHQRGIGAFPIQAGRSAHPASTLAFCLVEQLICPCHGRLNVEFLSLARRDTNAHGRRDGIGTGNYRCRWDLLVDNQQHKIRLSDIDAPERKQPFSTRAKQALSELAFGKQARVVKVTVERYGRIVGRIYVGELDVNRELVARGFAWV